MNELAETAIAHELAVIGVDLEEKLTSTMDLLRDYRTGDVESDIQAFARAEITEKDPLRARALGFDDDLHGIGAAFAHPLE